ncbi:protein kinase, partial [bacterium]|nr:protein kinase [bacterium]
MAKHLAKCPKCGEKLTYESSVGDRIQCASCGAVLKAPGKGAPSDPLIGQTLGEFEIRSLLGRGGMGSVYKARQESLGRDVAIKVLPEGLSKDAAFVARFRREARSAAAVRHPNIIEVFSVGEDRGHQYIAMEFIAGDTLGQILNRDERLDPARTLDLLKQTAAALSAAHETGVLHRDIKPGNILIDRRGLAKVADFGLAKRPDSDVNVTQTGSSLGTPLYMPPETCRGQEADARSDLYSLGATFYQALAGRPPFQGTSPTALIAQHLEDAPPKLKGLAPAASSALCRTIHKLLRKKPGERYQSADELLGILAKLDPKAKIATGEPRARRSAAGSPSRETRASRHPHDTPTSKKKSSAPFILGGVAAIVLAVVLVFALGGKNDEKPQAKVPPKKTQTPAPAKKVAPAPKKKSPTPPKKKAPPPPRDPKEREAVDFFARAQRTAKPGTWLSAEGYLAKLDRDYAKTKYYAANRAEIAALKAKVEAALKKPVPPKPPEAPATTPLPPPDAEGWISLFNGRTLAGRAPGDRRGNGRVVDGWLQVANTLGFFFDIRARDVEFRATMARTDGKAGGGLLLRADDESYYSALADPSGHCAIDRRADGRFTALIKGDAGRELGESFQLMASAIGDTITLYVDGKKVLETRDATLRAGRVGLRAFRGALRFKNVAVRVLDKAPAAPVAPPPPEPAAPKVDVGLAAALEPIDAKLAAWDFAGAAELVSKAALPPE